jgi:hypothetical protein
MARPRALSEAFGTPWGTQLLNPRSLAGAALANPHPAPFSVAALHA